MHEVSFWAGIKIFPNTVIWALWSDNPFTMGFIEYFNGGLIKK